MKKILFVFSAWHCESESSFFCSLWYDSDLGRFEYPVADPVSSDPSDQKFCGKCEVNREKENRYTLQVMHIDKSAFCLYNLYQYNF